MASICGAHIYTDTLIKTNGVSYLCVYYYMHPNQVLKAASHSFFLVQLQARWGIYQGGESRDYIGALPH